MNIKTKRLLDAYCERPFTSLILLGRKSQGAEQCIAYVKERLLSGDNRNNVIRILPEEGKSLTVDQIRELKNSLTTKSLSSNQNITRIAYVADFHTASFEAQNALLKLLEEPAESTAIVLHSNDRNSILPTILSRCHVVPMLPLSNKQIAEMIGEQGINEQDLKRIQLISNGDYDTVVQLAETKNFNSQSLDLAKKFLSMPPFERLQMQKEFETASSLKELLEQLLLLANAGLHHAKSDQLNRWKRILLELREIERLQKKNVLHKIVYLRLCTSL